jgi:hypothetical protein
MHTNTNPTERQAAAFVALYDHFNAELFGGELAPCLLNFSRKSGALGFFAPERWSEDGAPVHEISINPMYLSERTAQQTASTLVHEMAHAWQQEHGTPGRRGYHNREWAEKMEAVGLTPSSTGAPGGSRTGQRMTHFVTPGGVFEAAWARRPDGTADLFPLVCQESHETTTRKAASVKSKTKYTCGCGINIWAKPGIECLHCSDCGTDFVEAAE